MGAPGSGFSSFVVKPARRDEAGREGFELWVDGGGVSPLLFQLDHSKEPLVVPPSCVAVRRAGRAVGWLAPPPGDALGGCLPLVEAEPVWFSVDEYARMLAALGCDAAGALERVRPLSASESAALFAAATRRLAGCLAGPDELLYQEVTPPGDGANALLDRMDQLDDASIEDVATSEPAALWALEECFDVPGHPVVRRLLREAGPAEPTYWHIVGRGCWGKLRWGAG